MKKDKAIESLNLPKRLPPITKDIVETITLIRDLNAMLILLLPALPVLAELETNAGKDAANLARVRTLLAAWPNPTGTPPIMGEAVAPELVAEPIAKKTRRRADSYSSLANPELTEQLDNVRQEIEETPAGKIEEEETPASQ